MSMDFFNFCSNNQLANAKERYAAGDIDLNFQDPGKRTALSMAASRGHLEVVTWLLELGSPLESKDRNDRTALALAAINGRIEVMKRLIEAGASLEARSDAGRTILLDALDSKQAEAAKLAILSGADINALDNCKKTALHYAAQNKFPELVSLLIEKGARINCFDKYSITPLGYALKARQTALAEQILGAGADINYKDEQGSPILYEFIKDHNKPAVEWCLTHGADPMIPNKNGTNACEKLQALGMEEFLELAKKNSKHIEEQENNSPELWISRGIVDIFEAIKKNHPGMTSYYLSQGIDVNEDKIYHGEPTKLFCIAISYADSKIWDILFHAGLHINQIFPWKRGYSYLSYALRRTKSDAVKFLLEHGADPNNIVESYEGHVYDKGLYIEMLFDYYCFDSKESEIPELAKAFIDHGAIIEHSAIMQLQHRNFGQWYPELCRMMLNSCKDINEMDRYGETILHNVLESYHHTSTFEQSNQPEENEDDILINAILDTKGIDVTIRDDRNYTPLYYACRYTTVPIVKRLLEMGAEPDPYIWEAATQACDENRTDILEYLLESGIERP